MKLSRNFKRSEFTCKCGCGFDVVDYELLYNLEFLRYYFNKPITINCCARCEKHNKEVGGKEASQHLIGKAADIVVKSKTPKKVYEFIDTTFPNKYGIGLYNTFVHFDVRAGKARWGA